MDPIKVITELVKDKPPLITFKVPETINKDQISKESQEVLEHFGLEAPELLNNYCMALEDALIDISKAYEKLKNQTQDKPVANKNKPLKD